MQPENKSSHHLSKLRDGWAFTHDAGFIRLGVEGGERGGEGGEEMLHVLQLAVGHLLQPSEENNRLHMTRFY